MSDTGRGQPDAVLLHDGSFSCFLCAVAECLNAAMAGGRPPAVRSAGGPAGLFENPVPVARDDARAAVLWKRLCSRAGDASMRLVFEAFCSDRPDADSSAAVAVCRLWREGPRALSDLASADMLELEKASARSRAEAHLISGLVRFSELADGSWYASVRPSCDVLPLIGDHFSARFPDALWAIHDLGRGSALVHEAGAPWVLARSFSFTAEEEAQASGGVPPYSAAERELRHAWSRYFDAVAIQERSNPRLQAGHMPKRYWADLPEMNDAPEGSQ